MAEGLQYSIEESLQNLSMEEEAILLNIENSELISEYNDISEKHQEYTQDLSLLYKFFIAYWAKNHKKELGLTIEEYHNNTKSWDSRYANYKYSMLFKIKKGRGTGGIQKFYSGWNTYVKLSNGNIRYLMELVYRAYEKHLINGECLSSPVSHADQTYAAQDIGLKNLKELEGLWKNGAQLTKLLLGFGRIFNVLAREDGKTRAEVNQFTINGVQSKECEDIVTAAVMNLALVRIPGNKLTDNTSTKEYMYCLHPIYSPYFIFSYRKKRKMNITEADFMGIIESPKETIKSILLNNNITNNEKLDLPNQLMLFEDFYNND